MRKVIVKEKHSPTPVSLIVLLPHLPNPRFTDSGMEANTNENIVLLPCRADFTGQDEMEHKANEGILRFAAKKVFFLVRQLAYACHAAATVLDRIKYILSVFH